MESDRSLRTARAAVFAAACVGVSAAGHVWMSGSTLPAWVLLAALLVVGGAGYALAGRQRGFAPIAGLMLVGELGLHLLFTLAQHTSAGPASSAPGMPDMSGMPSMTGTVMSHPGPASAWLCGGGRTAAAAHGPMSMTWMSGHGSAGMIAAHAAAGLLCAWWLWRGEAAAFQLLRALARFAAPLLAIAWPRPPAVPDLAARTPTDRTEQTSICARLLVHAVVRRGPPAPVFSI